MRNWNSERGLSLVEATIILMVLAILTAVIAPSMGDFLTDSRGVKAREDVQAIGISVERLRRDVGITCLSKDPDPITTACQIVNRVDLLVSDGNDPGASAGAATLAASTAAATSYNWLGASANAVPASNRDTVDNQFMDNGVAYLNAGVNASNVYVSGAAPKVGIGWRGAYLTGPGGADPWGYKYQANTVYLTVAQNAATGTSEGQLQAGWRSDVFVVTGGANGVIDTNFSSQDAGGSGSKANADDIIYVLQGSTR